MKKHPQTKSSDQGPNLNEIWRISEWISAAARPLLTRTFKSSVSLGFRLGPNFFLSSGLGFAKARTFGEPGWVAVTPLAPERHENQANLGNENVLAFWPIGLKARTTHGKSWNVSVSVCFSLVRLTQGNHYHCGGLTQGATATRGS